MKKLWPGEWLESLCPSAYITSAIAPWSLVLNKPVNPEPLYQFLTNWCSKWKCIAHCVEVRGGGPQKCKQSNKKYLSKNLENPNMTVNNFDEASLLDRINMTKFWLEYDRKLFTPTNLNVGTWPKFTTPTNINFTQVRIGWDTCPALLAQLLCSSTRKKHQAWRLGGPRT